MAMSAPCRQELLDARCRGVFTTHLHEIFQLPLNFSGTFPTVAPTRVPTVHSLPLSLAGTSFMRMDIRKAAGPPLRPPAKATAKPAHHSRHSGSKTEGVYSRDMGRGNSREGGD
jgi:hypothetical protein